MPHINFFFYCYSAEWVLPILYSFHKLLSLFVCVTVYYSEFSSLALVYLELGSLGTLPEKTTLNNFANYNQNSMQIYIEEKLI